MKNRLIRVFREYSYYIVWCKKLNLTGYGKTKDEAFEMFLFNVKQYLKR